MNDQSPLILLIEDNPGHRALFVRYLRKSLPTARIVEAGTLAQAREAVAVACPDLALVDVQLPDGRGTDLLADRDALGSFPMVIMTSQGDEQAAVEAIKRGATDYVVKSEIMYNDIGHVVERALRDWSNLCSRQRAEEELRRSESKHRRLTHEFQTLLEGIADAIVLVDPQMRLVWANRVAIEAAAADMHWQTGMLCCRLCENRDGKCPDCPIMKTFQTGRLTEVVKEYPAGRFWGKRTFPLKDADGSVVNVIVMSTDITEKMQLRAESMRSSQLAALGELAAGVAHEINNPINGIINYAQLLLDRENLGNGRIFADNIITEGQRVAEIVRNLLTFSRKPQADPLPFSPAEALQGVLSLSEARLRDDGIHLELAIAPDLPEVLGHFQQFQQVLINLISNACYSLNEKYPGDDPGKRLLIEMTGQVSDDMCWLRTTVTDHGCGISSEILAKICDPFFTTKPRGSGTGLGMSISHGIVTAHRGRLMLSSKEGEWTKVIVDLPGHVKE